MQKIDSGTCSYSFYSPVSLARFSNCTGSILWRRCSPDIQKQTFGGVLWKRCSLKFHQTHRKTSASVFLFNKVGGLELQVDLKKDSDTFVFLWILRKLQNTFRELILKMDILQNSCSTEYQADCMVHMLDKSCCRSSILVNLQVYSLQL